LAGLTIGAAHSTRSDSPLVMPYGPSRNTDFRP
jgi:hypothetical protein